MDDHYKHPVDEKKVRFRPNIVGSKKDNIIWIAIITVLSFLLSASISIVSSNILKDVHIFIAFLVVLFIIIVNIIFDAIGTAVTAADETPFHAMASRKIYGARQAIKLIRNADKVSNFCNDVVGDISGVISGSASAYIVARLIVMQGDTKISLVDFVVTGMVASLTVGGKALEKVIAIRHSNYIIYKVSVIIQFLFGRYKPRKKKKKKISD